MATAFICGREWQGSHRRLCVGKNVRFLMSITSVCPSLRLFHSDEESEEKGGEMHGHVNSISVLRSYRRLGLAKRLMMLSRTQPTLLLPSLIDNRRIRGCDGFSIQSELRVIARSQVEHCRNRIVQRYSGLWSCGGGEEVLWVVLSRDALGFHLTDYTDGDGEDAYVMKLFLKNQS